MSSTPHPFIPGLVREVYIAGSRHSANTPQLIRSEVNDDTSVDFEWQAVGSSIYRVTAKGMLPGSSIDAFKVVCSCPDGDIGREMHPVYLKKCMFASMERLHLIRSLTLHAG